MTAGLGGTLLLLVCKRRVRVTVVEGLVVVVMVGSGCGGCGCVGKSCGTGGKRCNYYGDDSVV